MEMMRLVSDELYRELAKETGLNNVLKQLFSHFDTEADYRLLTERVSCARNALIDRQDQMILATRQNELLRTLPLFMIKDKASGSGGVFLRWRTFLNSCSGERAWQPVLAQGDLPDAVRKQFVAIEKDRILINLQMRVLSYVLRQLGDIGGSQIREIEKFL